MDSVFKKCFKNTAIDIQEKGKSLLVIVVLF